MFALIHAGLVVETAAVEFPVAAGLQWVDVSAVTPAPGAGWAFDGTNFAAPAPAAMPPVIAAQAALDASDRTLLRCLENGVAVPSAWAQYRTALRAIVAGGTATALPTRPAYPAGT